MIMMENLSLDDQSTIHPIAKTILQGIKDDGSPFSKLNGIPHVLQMIWRHVLWDMKLKKWKKHIKVGQEWFFKGRDTPLVSGAIYNGLIEIEDIEFPEPKDININMMPFLMSEDFDSTCLPDYLEDYHDKILSNIDYRGQEGEIGYLTIHESLVDEGQSQRRPGLHTESPGIIYVKNEGKAEKGDKCFDEKGGGSAVVYPMLVEWGRGGYDSELELDGGIYMASNVSNSCEVWDCQIVSGENGEEIIGKHGDIEHLRSLLPESTKLKANMLYWVTDRTPHESLPLKKGTYRQFIRVVTKDVSVWYKDHSTENPMGIPPGDAKIVRGSKFDGDVLTIVD
uniref:Uncharacterized protein n=1 Tax=Clytia hemisphaerica TaxID=252671 RepID=A0A7M5UU73_9CNID